MIPQQVLNAYCEQVATVFYELSSYTLPGESVKFNFPGGNVTFNFSNSSNNNNDENNN